jgi:hypothetical protein
VHYSKTFFLLSCLLSFSCSGAGWGRAIFGQNNIFESSASFGTWSEKKKAVAMMVSTAFLTENDDIFSLEESLFTPISDPINFNVCSDELFAKQRANPESCTGFLIAPNILATAGHCAVDDGRAFDDITMQCANYSWLFDFELEKDGKASLVGKSSNRLYHCKRVIAAISDYRIKEPIGNRPYGHDFALIELDRPVVDRPFLKLNSEAPQIGDLLDLIGHPLGLPQKISLSGRVNQTFHPYFYEATTDAFSGSSGSPVLNKKGEVVGIVVRGPDNFYYDEAHDCNRLNTCNDRGGDCVGFDPRETDANDGMHIQRIPFLLDYLK